MPQEVYLQRSQKLALLLKEWTGNSWNVIFESDLKGASYADNILEEFKSSKAYKDIKAIFPDILNIEIEHK